MEISSTLFIIFLVVNLIGLVVLTLLFVWIRQVSQQLKQSQAAPEDVQNVQNNQVEVMAQAQADAHTIVSKASSQASDLVKQATVLSDDVRKRLEADLQRLPKAQEDIYRGIFKQVGDEAIKMLQELATDMKAYADREVDAFGKALQDKILTSQKGAKEAIDEAYARAEKEIEMYKVQQMRRVDSSIHQVLREVTEEILGKAIHTEQHEELVMKSLEEVKKRQII